MAQRLCSDISSLAREISKDANLVATLVTMTTQGQEQNMSTDGTAEVSQEVQAIQSLSSTAEGLASQSRLVENCHKLLSLTASPNEQLLHLSQGYLLSAMIHFVVEFDIPEAVPISGDISYQELASSASVDESLLRRVLRYTILDGIFHESRPEYVSHSPLSIVLLDKITRSIVYVQGTDGAPPAANFVQAYRKYQGVSEETNETPWNLANGTDMPMFQYLAEREPKRMSSFVDGFKAMIAAPANSLEHVANGYDWAGLGACTVVDVGGSTGHTARILTSKFPDLTFTVQDLPNVINEATSENASDEQTNITYMSQNFFHPQPPFSRLADIFLLRIVLHDYPDKYAASILSHIIAVMKPGARILVVDTVMPDGIGRFRRSQFMSPIKQDFLMHLLFNGHERTLEQWKGLFRRADARLRILGSRTPEGSALSVMELGIK